MSKFISLSHTITGNTKGYGGEYGLEIFHKRNISNGDSSNNSEFKLNSHLGTHIDFPYHFSENGKKLKDYDIDFFIFDEVEIIELPNLQADTIIDSEYFNINNKNAELLLLKTDFGNYRDNDIYWKNNPGISPCVYDFLKDKMKNLRVIGFDFISISPYQNRELGREAHKKFLASDEPILLIEDMKLNHINRKTNFKKVIVSPLNIAELEASPCTIIGEFYE